ncbi:Signal recognition particle 54 kDa protein [Dissostichus eleginoides]|uniref:Signal recognition particle 54 kDa protein n=1 Tax=Dissostichus eleginoides TaxID=100907 RepID=A0AAD9F2I2_DISEL|nr:Signal recognition particle 54 kDa protein [Dissostichus eleginoides]
MQDILLRVFVVALGLLTYPREDPGVENGDDFTTLGMQKHEERLLREEEELDHVMAPEEMIHTVNGDPHDDFQPDQYVTKNISVLEDVSVTKQESEEDFADHNSDVTESQPQNSQREPETALQTSQIDQGLNGNVQFDKKSKEDTQTVQSVSFIDPGSPQGQQEKPEVIGSNDKNPLHHSLTPQHQKMKVRRRTWLTGSGITSGTYGTHSL